MFDDRKGEILAAAPSPFFLSTKKTLNPLSIQSNLTEFKVFLRPYSRAKDTGLLFHTTAPKSGFEKYVIKAYMRYQVKDPPLTEGSVCHFPLAYAARSVITPAHPFTV